MCLIPKRKYLKAHLRGKSIVTDKDIVCYKYLDPILDGRRMYSAFRLEPYAPNVLKTTTIEWHECDRIGKCILNMFWPKKKTWEVHEGLHAILDLNDKRYNPLKDFHNLYKVIIPVGSTIVEGESGDIVSNRMVVTDEIVSTATRGRFTPISDNSTSGTITINNVVANSDTLTLTS